MSPTDLDDAIIEGRYPKVCRVRCGKCGKRLADVVNAGPRGLVAVTKFVPEDEYCRALAVDEPARDYPKLEDGTIVLEPAPSGIGWLDDPRKMYPYIVPLERTRRLAFRCGCTPLGKLVAIDGARAIELAQQRKRIILKPVHG